MAILSRPKLNPQQRLDLEDWNALLSALRTDSKLWTKQFITAENLVLKGFTVSGIGLKQATVAMTDATLFLAENTSDFSYYIAEPGASDIVVPDSDLTDGTRNYVEIQLLTEDNTPLTKAFWDPEANGGSGAEFNQIVNTMTDLTVNITVSTGGFSGDPDKMPLAIIDTDGSGNIKIIKDQRPMFGRLAKPNDLDNEYAWTSKQEPIYSLTLTGVVGSFVAGETITIGGETATVITGGGASITFAEPTGVNYSTGDAVSGATSGATGNIDTVLESFNGVDKSLDTIKEIHDALMTEIKLMKRTRFWWQDANMSINGVAAFIDSVLVQNVVGAKYAWSGTDFSFTDGSGTPADADVLANLRRFGLSGDLQMTRQDGTGGSVTIPVAEGEILFIKVPETGSRTYSGVGAGDTNFQTVALADYVSSDENYWIAYREQGLLYVRGYGELEAGESTPISDPDKETILSLISASTSRANQDRTLKLIEGGTYFVNDAGTALTLSDDAYIQVPGLDQFRNTIIAQTINLPNATSIAYVSILRTNGVANNLVVNVADENLITLGDDDVVIARRVSEGILIGSSSFVLPPGAYLELDGAKAEIDRLLGQLRIKPHETDLDKARISTSEIAQLDGTTLQQIIGNFMLKFDGAVIDFTTGQVFESDGATPLGNNFTPATIPASEYHWYGVSLLPSSINVLNQQLATVQVDIASASNAVQASAIFPVISGTIKLGWVQVQNNAGSIERVDIQRLGVGSGSGGSGTGDANSFIETLKNRLNDSIFEAVTPYVASINEDDTNLIDALSSGTYSPAEQAFELGAISDTLISANVLDADFLANDKSINKVEVIVKYKETGIDTGAVYQVSRNGGNEYQVITMDRVDSSYTFRGIHEFSTEASNQTLQNNSVQDSFVSLGGVNSIKLAREFVVSNLSVIRRVTFNIPSIDGSPIGNLRIQVVRDDTGVPSTDVADILAESGPIDISTLTTGDFEVNFETVLAPGTYHLVIVPDQEYLDNYVASVTGINIGLEIAGTGDSLYNGTVWSPQSTAFTGVVEGIELDLKLKITSSVAGALIDGFGVFYEENTGNLALATTVEGITKVSFNAVADNSNEFAVPFLPNADTLIVHLLGSGQSFRFGDFGLQGNTVVFPVDQFNNGGVEKVQTLVFDQLRGGAFDNSDVNAALLAANGLGSTDGSIDKSAPGVGVKLKSPDGTKWHITVQNDGSIKTEVI